MTDHFVGTSDPTAADRMAKACLMLPQPGADPAGAQWVETALAKGTNSKPCLEPMAQRLCRASPVAACRRRGMDVQSSAELRISRTARRGLPRAWLQGAAATSQGRGPPRPWRARLTLLLHETAETRQRHFRAAWFDWIVVQTLMGEAQGLIEGGSHAEADKTSITPAGDSPARRE